MKASVDRKEGNWYILVTETGKTIQIPVGKYPKWKEGDEVNITEDEITQATKEAQDRIANARKGLNKVEL